MVTDVLPHLRDDGLAGGLVRSPEPGGVLPATAALAACVVAAAVGAGAGVAALVIAAVVVGIAVGTLAGRRADRRWSWTVPPLLRALEYGTVLWAGVLVEDAGPAAYAALAALAFRHYDLVYRGRTTGPAGPTRVARLVLGGWQLRTLLVVAAAAAGVVAPVLWVLAAVVAVVAVADAAGGWVRAEPRAGVVEVADEEEL